MGSGRLVGFEHVPYSTERADWKSVGETDGHSTPACLRRAIEGDRGLRVGVAWAALARLTGLNVVLLQSQNRLPDAGVNLPRHGGRRRRFVALPETIGAKG
jgi:hypothetical protein